ncbi:hypothetical protein KSNIM_12095, partial [Kitasatospora sp. DSM 101779]|nr:hypothetical protein [Kitasatospora sp. DSM 101779]
GEGGGDTASASPAAGGPEPYDAALLRSPQGRMLAVASAGGPGRPRAGDRVHGEDRQEARPA